jgi:hypothetical protein
MCTGIELILLGSTLVGTAGNFVQAGQQAAMAKSEADWQNYQLEIQNRQLSTDRKLQEINAAQVEAKRRDEARMLRASNEAFIAQSGVSQNISFLEGINPAADRALRSDIGSLRLNLSSETNRIADQIMVNKAQAEFGMGRAKVIGANAYTNAAFSSAADASSNYFKYDYYKT